MIDPGHIIEWLLAFALAMVAVAVVVAGVRAARPHRRIAASIAAVGDDALALICEPCNGGSGKCRCASKCGDWLCAADDTGIGSWTPAELAFLRGEETSGG